MENIAIIYWSGTGNTEIMANAIAQGITAAGGTVTTTTVDQCSPEKLNSYSKIAFGCPSMGDEVLEESEFEPFFQQVESALQGKKVALFGSYSWGDGQWMEDWSQRVSDNGANLFDKGLIVNETPDEEGVASCQEFGKQFSQF